MRIGRLVRHHVPAILYYCAAQDPAEFARLQERRFSKETFDLNYPFCRPVASIRPEEHMRFWRQEYRVLGVAVRVTSQWFNPPVSRSLPLFHDYLRSRGIAVAAGSGALPAAAAAPPATASRGRFRGSAIGNAQNLLVRNLLGRLGDEQFGAEDWARVVAGFGAACAYCGARHPLVMDHAIPINRQALGEHRLGNLVPACRSCNARKADRDFRDYLGADAARIAAIEAHMARQGYRPLGDQAQVKAILARAHQEVRELADRYVAILDAALGEPPRAEPRRDGPDPEPAD